MTRNGPVNQTVAEAPVLPGCAEHPGGTSLSEAKGVVRASWEARRFGGVCHCLYSSSAYPELHEHRLSTSSGTQFPVTTPFAALRNVPRKKKAARTGLSGRRRGGSVRSVGGCSTARRYNVRSVDSPIPHLGTWISILNGFQAPRFCIAGVLDGQFGDVLAENGVVGQNVLAAHDARQ